MFCDCYFCVKKKKLAEPPSNWCMPSMTGMDVDDMHGMMDESLPLAKLYLRFSGCCEVLGSQIETFTLAATPAVTEYDV